VQTGYSETRRLRVLYSFPHKLGSDRICTTAWYQVDGLAKAGADVLACPGALSRSTNDNVRVRPTLARGPFRIPYSVLGDMRAFSLHDHIVSRRLNKLAGQIDIVHTWPLGALETLKAAKRLGIPAVLERPNAHTRFAYEVVQQECERLGVTLPSGHEHAYKADVLRREEAEYELATKLLCPSDFVARTFLDRGFSQDSLARHRYGFDDQTYRPSERKRDTKAGLVMLFVGGCAPRKGLHYALEAWLTSDASKHGTFLIAGAFVPGYAEKLGTQLEHPSVKVLGHRHDVPQLMQSADILILPSIEEGSALVTSEARGSGCVLVVSDAAGAICEHMQNGMVHRVADVTALTDHLNLLNGDRDLLARLRARSLQTVNEITWQAAGKQLYEIYQSIVAMSTDQRSRTSPIPPPGLL